MEPYIDEFGNLQFKQPANYTGINGINMNQLNIEPYNSMAEMRGQPESRSVLDQGLPFALPNLNYRNYDLSNLFNTTEPDLNNSALARRLMTQPGLDKFTGINKGVYDPYGIKVEDGRFSYDMNKTSLADYQTMAPQQTFQDYYSGIYEPYDPEKDDEQVDYLPGQYSFKDRVGKFARNVIGQPGISSLIGFINPVAGLVTRGIGALGKALGPKFTGVRGGQNLYSDTGFNTFAKSTSLVDFLQRRRDQKARDEAAARGAAKQAEAARLQAMKAVRNTGGGNGGGSVESRGGGASYGTRQESGWESSPF